MSNPNGPQRAQSGHAEMRSISEAKQQQSLWQRLESIETFDLIAFMTVGVVYFVAHTSLYQLVTIAILVMIGLSRRVRRAPWIWLFIVCLFTPRLVWDWYHNEDHVYLAVYWCAAMGLSRLGRDTDRVLAINARLLIGLAFAFATFWKVTVPSFYDGSLCTYKLLFDYRFRQAMTQPILGLSDSAAQHNRMALVSLRETGSQRNRVRLTYPDSVVLAGRFLAVWTIAIEGALAAAFLLPQCWIPCWMRNGSLLLFTLTTYLVVPVLGFGLLFMTMGAAQTSPSQPATRLAYLATAVMVLLRFSS